MKINILWKATKPQYVGVGSDIVFVKRNGVEQFDSDSYKEIDEWIEMMSVSYGEEAGTFKILGFWYGKKEDLLTGKATFYGKEYLFRMINSNLER